ncbi:hypothetical protein BCJMU10_2533 [Bacillus cereus]|nr:hypothetical protein BCJMU10_2533 [Bacillus cereus]
MYFLLKDSFKLIKREHVLINLLKYALFYCFYVYLHQFDVTLLCSNKKYRHLFMNQKNSDNGSYGSYGLNSVYAS